MRTTERSFIALLIGAALAACGGGGSGSSGSSIVPTGTGTTPPTSAPVGTGTSAPSSAPAGYARASFSITIPKSTGPSSRARQTVGSGTQSITFTLLQTAAGSTTGTPQTFPLTSTSPGCSSGPNGVTCTLSLNAPLGLDVFLAQTYTSTTGSGTLTGSGAVQLNVSLNSTNTASLSLTSQAASVYLTSSSTFLGAPFNQQQGAVRREPAAVRKTATAGAINSMRVFVIALDSAGNTILNPSIYDQPISLQLFYTDGYNTPLVNPVADVTLSVAYSASVDPGGCGYNATTSAQYGAVQVCSPADVITASYQNISNGATNATIFGSVGTGSIAPSPAPSVPPTPFPQSTPANQSFISFPINITTLAGIQLFDGQGNPVTSVTSLSLGTTTLPPIEGPANSITVFESGFFGDFVVGGNCNTIANIPIQNGENEYASIQVNTIAVGTCTATISDGTNSVSLPITVTTTTVTGS